MGCINIRYITLSAPRDGSVDSILKEQGFSTALRRSLRVRLGDVCVRRNGVCVPLTLTAAACRGEVLEITLREEVTRRIAPYDFSVEIIYQDEDIAIVCKPSGLATMPVGGHYGRALDGALAALWGGDFVYRPVGRLDRDTSGLMIVAKNALAHCKLAESGYEREYYGVCRGIVPETGIVDAPIGPVGDGGMKRCVRQDGKQAITRFRRLAAHIDCSEVEFVLETGRTHQIRVHADYIGHALCGDRLYGEEAQANARGEECVVNLAERGSVKITRQALHCRRIAFRHPISGAKMEFCSPPHILD